MPSYGPLGNNKISNSCSKLKSSPIFSTLYVRISLAYYFFNDKRICRHWADLQFQLYIKVACVCVGLCVSRGRGDIQGVVGQLATVDSAGL